MPHRRPIDASLRDRHDICPMAEAIKIVGSTWRLLTIRYLMAGPKSFNALMKTAYGVNSKTLSRTLKTLQREGLINRRVVSTQPFAVEYSLTEKGMALEAVVRELGLWGERWILQPVSYTTGRIGVEGGMVEDLAAEAPDTQV